MSHYFDTKQRKWIAGEPPAPAKPGAGTILKRKLESFGITGVESCQCAATVRRMDAEGPDWCEAHIEGIVTIMVEEAERRNWLRFLPFKGAVAEAMIRAAIAEARQ